MSYALQAWATEPDNANYKDTVAGVLEANSQYNLAEALEREAIGRGGYAKQNESFQKDLAAISSRTLCPPGQ